MINRSVHLIFFALILLSLSACLPQVELEQPAQAVDTATATAVPTNTVPIETIVTSPILEPVTPSPESTTVEELTMPVEPTAQPPVPVEEEPTDPPADQQSSQPPAGPTLQPGVQNWIDQAKEDLAQRLKISSAEIDLLSFESKVWPDGGLGCPQPGMNYIQVLVEGYLIQLSAGDQTYNYHGGGNRGPFLCQQPWPEIIITKQAPFDIREVATKIVPPPSD